MEQKKGKEKDRKTLSFFLIGFPTILIIAQSILYPTSWFVSIALGIYQLLVLKQFLDDYYKVL